MDTFERVCDAFLGMIHRRVTAKVVNDEGKPVFLVVGTLQPPPPCEGPVRDQVSFGIDEDENPWFAFRRSELIAADLEDGSVELILRSCRLTVELMDW